MACLLLLYKLIILIEKTKPVEKQERKHESGQTYDIPQWEQILLKTRLPVTEGKTLMITGLKNAQGILNSLIGKNEKSVPGGLENMIILIKPEVIVPAEATEEAIGAVDDSIHPGAGGFGGGFQVSTDQNRK